MTGTKVSLGVYLFNRLNEEDPWLLKKIMEEYYALEDKE
jgi:hypothetical protein